MEDKEFPSNSMSARKSPKYGDKTPSDPVKKEIPTLDLAHPVTLRKKPVGTRIKNAIFSADSKEVGTYLLTMVMLPAAKNLLMDIVYNGTQKALYGNDYTRVSNRTIPQGISRPSSMYHASSRTTPPWETGRNSQPSRDVSNYARANHDFSEIVIADRDDALRILENLSLLIDQYDVVTVHDFYQMIGRQGTHVDAKWGWTDVSSGRPQRVQDGYILDLPKPISLPD